MKIFWLVFGLTLGFLTSFLGKYGWIGFATLCTGGVSLWLLTWLFTRKEAGALLLNAEQSSRPKLFGLGILQMAVGLAVFIICLFFLQVSSGLSRYTSLEELSRLGFQWSSGVYFVALVISNLEFRENGICHMYSLISWQRIKSYTWEQSKPNTLTIRFKPRFPLFPRSMSMAIPSQHRDSVSYILNERLQSKNLGSNE